MPIFLKSNPVVCFGESANGKKAYILNSMKKEPVLSILVNVHQINLKLTNNCKI